MLNRFKDAVGKSTAKSNRNSGERPPPTPKPEKYCYSRPHFLGLDYEESLASRDFGDRPIMTPRDRSQLPLQAGYAECINGGKSDFNEDQATGTELHLKSHLRTDIALSCLDISLSNSLSKKETPSPGPSTPTSNFAKANSQPYNLIPRHTIKRRSDHLVSPDKDTEKDPITGKPPGILSTSLSSETELIDFVGSTSDEQENKPKLVSTRTPEILNIVPQLNHMMTEHHEEKYMPAIYYGLFDGHAGHTVSLIASKLLHMIVKEKLELCMGVIQKILALNCLHPEKGGSTDMTVDQLVIGALEEAFMEMDDQLEREHTTYLIKGGCTALVALFFHGKLYVANAGDSRAVLCSGDKTEAMSQDFTAETERDRLNYLGFCEPELLHNEFSCYEFLHRVNKPDIGKHVICRKPGREGWVLKLATEEDLRFPLIVGRGKRARVMGTIGVTRCLGDHDLYVFDSDIWIKPFLSSKPEVKVLDLSNGDWSNDDVLIMASDGLWDTVSNDKAADIVRNTLKQPYQQENDKYTVAAQELVQEARGLFTGRGWRDKDDEMASFDDITVFVIPLKSYIDQWRQNQSFNKSKTS